VRAYQIQEFGIDKLTEIEQEAPSVVDDQILVRIHSVSLNYRDVMVVSGTYNPKMRLPAIPFSDAAGEVVEVGKAVTRWKAGDRVCPVVVSEWLDGQPSAETSRTAIGAGRYEGVLREYAAFNENAVVAMPEHLSFREASTLPCAAVTAWNALHVSGGLQADETVLTLGGGGVSLFALQFAKLCGARVISTSSSDQKLAKLKELGADEVINYREADDWSAAVLELTGGRGVDHVVEVGGAGTLERSIKSVRVGGHIALIGALATSGSFNPIPLFMKAIRLQGIFIGSKRMFEDMNRRISEAELRPVIDREFEFSQVREALDFMASGQHFGKIVVNV
jgi:NADPH:quinone reductase-like Zn-dependent oxidoreductase